MIYSLKTCNIYNKLKLINIMLLSMMCVLLVK